SYTKDLCLILKQLHTAIPAIVHRDIKPSNVIITSYNRAVLLDFNAAKYYTPSSSEDTVLLGTQGYAAPEQYGFGASSPQTDIYSLGIMLREMSAAVTPSTHIFDAIIEKCTQLRPSERFGDVTELENALASLAKKAPKKQYMNVLRKYALPGFRTAKPWKMLIAVPVYLFILWLCLTLEVKNTYGFALWAERLITLLMMLFLIFGTFNYMDVQQAIPLCQHKKQLVRILGIILLDLAVIMGLFVILLFIVSFIAPALPL
ncbi:MAG: protein kinase, partial [Lachnospiraceae bacterium]|nr:protein kinase [Candidatus Equihabitans merdae]